MVMIVNPIKFRIKGLLKEAVLKGERVMIEDPSIFNPRVFSTDEIKTGERIVVTNHPKRSYFATIEKGVDGRLKVY